jgi:WD40 repeat protein
VIRIAEDAVDLVSLDSRRVVHLDHRSHVDSVSVSSDGLWIATRTNPKCGRGSFGPGILRVWQTAQGEQAAVLPLDIKFVSPSEYNLGSCTRAAQESAATQEQPSGPAKLVQSAIAWPAIPFRTPHESSSADGDWRAVVKGSAVELHPTSTADRWINLQHGGAVTGMVFSPDGRWLVTSSEDATARVWALTRDDLIATSCARLTHDISEEDRQAYLKSEIRGPICPDLPVPSE